MSQKQLMQDSIDHRDYPIEEGVIIDSLDIRLQEIIRVFSNKSITDIFNQGNRTFW
jgi:hypothetical protein